MKRAPSDCCNGACKQGRDCPARRVIRWPLLCTRCGSRDHYAEDCTLIPKLGLSECELDMLDDARRDRNIVLAIVAILMALYFGLSLIGGTDL